jgi:hypothetical protein
MFARARVRGKGDRRAADHGIARRGLVSSIERTNSASAVEAASPAAAPAPTVRWHSGIRLAAALREPFDGMLSEKEEMMEYLFY